MFSQASVILLTGGSGRHPPGQTHPLWADTPLPRRRPLQRMVRILLECIPVLKCNYNTQLNLIIVMISQNLLLQQAKVEILLFCCRSHFWIFYLKHTISYFLDTYKFKRSTAFQNSWSATKMLLIQLKYAQYLL